MVQTVTGQIEPGELGFVLVHEHVFHDIYEPTMNSNLILSDGIVARRELAEYKDAGGTTIVDQTCHGLNPDPEALAAVASDVGINIIAGTGFYRDRFYPDWMRELSETDLVKVMVGELTKGIAGTDVRAGIIGEIGSYHRTLLPSEERVFRASAAAQRETGVPISTHALFTRIGLAQAQCLEAAGANLERVVIGHVDTTPDIEYHELLIRMGVWIAYDSIGQLDKQSDERRADAIAELVRRGHAGRVLLSSDVGKRGALREYGGHGYRHVIMNFLPVLRERGVSEEHIAEMTVRNPRRLFGGEGS